MVQERNIMKPTIAGIFNKKEKEMKIIAFYKIQWADYKT